MQHTLGITQTSGIEVPAVSDPKRVFCFTTVMLGTTVSPFAFTAAKQGRPAMKDTSELRSLAHKSRRLADAISDGPARDNLRGLADEYEQRAAIEQPMSERPLMKWAQP